MVSQGYLQYWQDNGDIACPFPRQTPTVGLYFNVDKDINGITNADKIIGNHHGMCSKG